MQIGLSPPSEAQADSPALAENSIMQLLPSKRRGQNKYCDSPPSPGCDPIGGFSTEQEKSPFHLACLLLPFKRNVASP